MTRDLGIEGIDAARLIGSGGSAAVYAAIHRGRDVAVKVFQGAVDSERSRRSFRIEQEAFKRVSDHPGIVEVLGFGINDRDQPYLLMPLFTQSLRARLDANGPLAWGAACEIIAQVADAVGHAHAHRVLHRDIKPANILLDENGQPKLSDFGIAKLTDATVSASTSLVTTPSFTAPERFDGHPATISTDVYALGATLAMLLTGEVPYKGEHTTPLAIVRQITSGAQPDLGEVDAPFELKELVYAAMAADPEDRPASAIHFAAEVRRIADGLGASEPADWELAKGSAADEHRRSGGGGERRLPRFSPGARIAVGALAVAAVGVGLLFAFGAEPSSLVTNWFGETQSAEAQPEDQQATTVVPVPSPTVVPTAVPAALNIDPTGTDFDRIYRELDGARQYVFQNPSLIIDEYAGPYGGGDLVRDLIDNEKRLTVQRDYSIDAVTVQGWVTADRVQLFVVDTVDGPVLQRTKEGETNLLRLPRPDPTNEFVVTLQREAERWKIVSDLVVKTVDPAEEDNGTIVYTPKVLPDRSSTKFNRSDTLNAVGTFIEWSKHTFIDLETHAPCIEFRSDYFRMARCVKPSIMAAVRAGDIAQFTAISEQQLGLWSSYFVSMSHDTEAEIKLFDGSTRALTSLAPDGEISLDGELTVNPPLELTIRHDGVVVLEQQLEYFDN